MNSPRVLAIAMLIDLASVTTTVGRTEPGVVGDGNPSIYYVSSTGEFGVQPEGYATTVFQIYSASGIFTADAVFPPGTLFDANTANEKGWAGLLPNAIRKDFSLGVIAAAGLTTEFLLNDLTLGGPGSFNHGPRFDLVTLCCAPLIPLDANLGDRGRGIRIEHQFMATGESPITWSNLTLTSTLGPTIAPTLSDNGQFSWNSIGSPLGSYRWDATVTNTNGSAIASLIVRLIPEPSSATLFGLAMIFYCRLLPRR
jgi:hypothetical protein